MAALPLGACASTGGPDLHYPERVLDWEPRPLAGIRTVEVHAARGLLRVVPGDALKARVLVQGDGSGLSLEGLQFAPPHPRPGRTRLAVLTDRGAPPAVRIELVLPRGLDLEVRGRELEVDFEALAGSVEVEVDRGRVSLGGLARRGLVRSDEGEVRVEGSYAELTVETASASVAVDLGQLEHSLRHFEVTSHSGTVELQGAPRQFDAIHFETSGGRVHGDGFASFAPRRPVAGRDQLVFRQLAEVRGAPLRIRSATADLRLVAVGGTGSGDVVVAR